MRGVKKILLTVLAALSLAVSALAPPLAAMAATEGATTVADPSTATTWRSWFGADAESSTQNVGRIWTDKTVSTDDIVLSGAGGEKTIAKGDSDFLTVFSAISSTSNLRETATTPLDIVLVLDASGSMDDPMGNGDSTKRIEALKEAANSFIDEIAARNALISNEGQQHRVSIVKFSGNKTDRVGNDTYRDGQFTYNYSQVMKPMALVSADTVASFKSMVNGIKPAGATRSDHGLELAQSQLASARADARKIVVFFTDGVPTDFSNFNSDVANSGVAAAKAMKDSGATIYTVGIQSGADPSGTDNTNRFMNAVSSNYPNATGYEQRNLGARTEDAAFYKTATNAADLKTIFNDISKEISDAAGYPTDVTDGMEDSTGCVTFTDRLGDYMKVDDFNHIVFANQVFDAHTKTTDGNVDTYHFEGSVQNTIYPNGNLNTIIIEVRHAAEDDLRTGDHVTVKIPAALIPLRAFEVNADNNAGSVTLTFPIRVFFGSSLKDGVKELLANPDAQMTDYIASHTDANGKVYFLANAWSGGSDGDATASFTPAEENSYYYITRDTPIYENEALTEPAKYPLEAGKTYYYQRQYWDIAATTAEQKQTIVSFDSSAVENINGYVSDTGDGHAQFSRGTRRMTYINELYDDKDANNTETASSFINPKWSGANKTGGDVIVRLGNNGKLALELPGSLEVEKHIEVPDGFDAADFSDDEFEFTISIPEAAGKTATATVTKDGAVQGDENFSITFDANGNYSHKLKDGEKLTVTGLDADWTYKVSEATKSGWTTAAEGTEGIIAAGDATVAKFTNTYAAAGTLSGKTSLAGEKTITGRNWVAGDKFAFVLTAVDGAPMPADAVDGKLVKIMMQPEGASGTTPMPFNFGDITYTQPGTYVYNIVEARAGDGYDVSILPGMSVSQALYRVTVTVTQEDAHDGTLKVESSMLRLKDDSGAELAGGAGESTQVAAFTNVFDVKDAEWNLRGTKTYTDNSGTKPLTSGMFKFELTAKTDGAPMPANAEDGKATASVDATGRFAFGQIKFDENDVNPDKPPKTFEYELREVNDGVHGMTYDATVWHITVTVSLTDDGTVVINAVNQREAADGALGTAELVSFDNTYEPDPTTVQNFIHGTKTLMGRDALDGEKFTFSLTQVSGPADGCTGFSPTAEVADAKNNQTKSFGFGDATFTKPGTYVFEVREITPDQPAGGMTYDEHACTVTIVVNDVDGALVAEPAMYSDGANASFINSYGASDTAYAGITVSKTLTGRTMREGEFSFTITGEDATSEVLLADSDRAFSNDGQRASGEKNAMTKLNSIVFNRTDAGEYRFKVAEVIPADDAKLSGVTYDTTEHEVVITVEDALDGTLRVTTTVDGQPGSEVAFNNAYAAAPGSFATASFGLAKVLEGRDWAADDAFTFELVGLNDAPMPANSQLTVTAADAANGRAPFDFGEITYSAAGVYEYEVHEVGAGQTIAGVDYSTNVAHFRVTVTDAGTGQLVASSRLIEGSAAFVNRYSAELDYNAKGGLTITKALEGTTAAAGRFVFTIAAETDDILGIAGTYESPEITDGGTVTIAATSGDIVFTQNDAGKTWNYTVTENDPGAGYACECSTWNVSVSVENDAAAGRLVVTTTVTGGETSRTWTYTSDGEAIADAARVEFVNRYAATGSTTDIVGTKELTGRLMNDDEFSFELIDVATGNVVATATNQGGEVNFGSLSYSAPGAYSYVAREVTDGLSEAGVTATTGSFTLTVTVTDNGDGTLSCDVTYPDHGLTFKNTYGTEDAELEVAGTKTLEVADGLLGPKSIAGQFTFTITGEDGAPMPERTVVTNDASDGSAFSFGKIHFTLENVFGEKTEEPVTQAEPDAVADQTEPTPDGEKNVQVDAAEPEAEPSVEEPVLAEPDAAAVPVAPEDTPEAPAASEPDLDTPVVEELSEPVAPTAPDATDAATLNAARWQTFRRNLIHIASEIIEPQVAGTSRHRILHYTVTETGHMGGVTNDVRATRDVYIKVTDDGAGKLTAEFVDADGNPAAADLAFTNHYDVTPNPSSVTDQVTITKALTGRDLAAGEFSFEMLEDGIVVATGTNDAVGNVTMSPITYGERGTHSYVIREVNAGKTIDGVKYSGNQLSVNAAVTDNGNGTLRVTYELVGGSTTFENVYNAAPADVTISAKKVLTGAKLSAGQFTFTLTGNGQELTATNDADGNVVFPHLLLDAPGTYVYELCELNDGQANVTYDERVYTVTITVTDDGTGHLSAEVTTDSEDEALTFTNTYTPPTPEPKPTPQPPAPKPEPPAKVTPRLPKTGDATSEAPLAALAAVAVALLAGALFLRKK